MSMQHNCMNLIFASDYISIYFISHVTKLHWCIVGEMNKSMSSLFIFMPSFILLQQNNFEDIVESLLLFTRKFNHICVYLLLINYRWWQHGLRSNVEHKLSQMDYRAQSYSMHTFICQILNKPCEWQVICCGKTCVGRGSCCTSSNCHRQCCIDRLSSVWDSHIYMG